MHIDYAYIVEYVGIYIDVHICILVLSSFHLIGPSNKILPLPAITAEDHSVLHCLSTLTVE